MHVGLYPLIAAILFASNALIPQLGIIAAIFSPLMLLLYLAHEKRTIQYDAMLVMLIVGMAVFNHVLAGFFLISPVFTAFFIRYVSKRNIHTSWLPAVGGAAATFIITFAIIYGIEPYREGLVEFTANALKTFIEAAKEINAPMVSSPYFAQVEAKRTESALAVVLLFPAFNYAYTVFSAFVSLRLFAKIKKVPLERFRLPDNFVWVLILSLFVIFTPFMYGRFIGVNFAFIFLTLYAFQGFDIILFWLNKLKVMPFFKAIIFIFIFSEPPIILIISLVGLFSVWFNFYGKEPEEQEKSE